MVLQSFVHSSILYSSSGCPPDRVIPLTYLLDRALIEVLYGCGLRVSELIGLNIGDIHYGEGLIICKGKGDKQRYIPINKHALLAINDYKINFRDKLKYKENENKLFLNKKFCA